MYKFDIETFLKELEAVGIPVKEVVQEEERGIFYISFTDSNIQYISGAMRYSGYTQSDGSDPRINIFHSESATNRFEWNSELNYKELVNTLKEYHALNNLIRA